MVMIRHPLTKAEYRKQADATVAVTWPDGSIAVFDRDGKRLSGVRRTADPALCLWVAAGSDTNTIAAALAGNTSNSGTTWSVRGGRV